MALENKYSNWYDKYNKQEQKPKQQKAPYRIKRVIHDMGQPISGMEDALVYALSPAQARVFFLKKHPRLQDNLSMGHQLVAEIAQDVFEEEKRQEEQIAELNKQRKIDEDEFVQNAWWND